MRRLVLLLALCFSCSFAQYGLYGSGYNGYGGYGSGYGTGYGMGYGMGYPMNPYMNQVYGTDATEITQPNPNPPTENQRDCRGLPSMRSRSLCRYGSNPMMSGGGGMYGAGGCMDLSPQCSVWASTGQCSTNPMMMRQTCAMSCGTCSTGVGALGSMGSYNPFGGYGGMGYPQAGLLDPLAQFIGRSIYETGILRQPTPSSSSKSIGILTKAKSEQLPSR
ncbi:ShKT domain-containing protein [Caenorhabditis elegans]|uniref:ShKT domain-containing protein n=2 Tax=Caenorhabditis elegans TaxID=6239 RepID=U4PQR0_CAEEL|nr:ShKT domain-containing protein [Caenorhabditis elegans]CDH92931.1 ShKT domain-containing protein [Caenorhabditis elegans]|eukprot:NP_001294247.1 Uncharacterized protein CELE_K09B3.1 [Caenorhabditis elegans]